MGRSAGAQPVARSTSAVAAPERSPRTDPAPPERRRRRGRRDAVGGRTRGDRRRDAPGGAARTTRSSPTTTSATTRCGVPRPSCDLPVHQHQGSGSPDASPGQDVGKAVTYVDHELWTRLTMSHLIVGGVFDRHPDLTVVWTEMPGLRWVVEDLERMTRQLRVVQSRYCERPPATELLGGVRHCDDGRAGAHAARVLPAQLLRRREHPVAARGALDQRARRRSHHVGPRLPPSRRRDRSHDRRSARELRRRRRRDASHAPRRHGCRGLRVRPRRAHPTRGTHRTAGCRRAHAGSIACPTRSAHRSGKPAT